MDHEDNVNVFLAHDGSMESPLLAKAGSLKGLVTLDGSLDELRTLKLRSRLDVEAAPVRESSV